MVIPAPRKKCPSRWLNGAPPLTAQATWPPMAAHSRASYPERLGVTVSRLVRRSSGRRETSDLISRTYRRIELRHRVPGPVMAPDIRSRYAGGTASAIGQGHGRLRFPARRPRSRDCGRSPVNVEECRRGGIGLARHVVYGCARADQGLAGDPVVMAAQQQVHGIGPLRCRRHDGPHHGVGRAAARPVLPVGPHGQLARVWRSAPGFRSARASAPARKSQLHELRMPGQLWSL